MIIRQATTVFFHPVAEYKERHDFEEDNPDFRKIAESTTSVIYEKIQYFRTTTAGAKMDEAEPDDTYCTEENCPIYQNDLSCERCIK